jgi:peptidoglycan/xylan/chitin deacetylase (PgdA/CDA1 family)
VSDSAARSDVRHQNSLHRLLAPLDAAELEDAAPTGRPQWLRAGDWRLFATPRLQGAPGENVERFTLENGETVNATWDANRGVFVPFSLAEAYENYLSERWRAAVRQKQLTQRQLALYYRLKLLIPRSLQLTARRMLIRWQGLPEFPAWPLEMSVVRLLCFYARCLLLENGLTELRFRWFWPGAHDAALILTHDVESADGLRLAVEIADLEQERGLRSSFNLVAHEYVIDDGVVRELMERGFEIGVHGVYHDRSMFSGREAFEAQLPAVRHAAERLGAHGFRSPATHRVFDWLGELPVSYDCSIPHSDPFEPQPGGCCTLWPYFIGNVVELPYTLPQDHTVLTLLSHSSIDLWLTQLARIERVHGLAQVLTHPDPGYLGDARKRRLYIEFLDAVIDRGNLWRPLPRDVATWWRQRASLREEPPNLTAGTVAVSEGNTVEFRPPDGSVR